MAKNQTLLRFQLAEVFDKCNALINKPSGAKKAKTGGEQGEFAGYIQSDFTVYGRSSTLNYLAMLFTSSYVSARGIIKDVKRIKIKVSDFVRMILATLTKHL